METFEGPVNVYRYAQRRRWNRAGRLISPPPYVLATIDTGTPCPGGRTWFLRFTPRVKAHAEVLLHEGHRVRVTCQVRRYANGIGGDALRATVECADEAEHIMAVLAGRK